MAFRWHVTFTNQSQKNLFDNMLIASQQASVHSRQLCPKHKGQKKKKELCIMNVTTSILCHYTVVSNWTGSMVDIITLYIFNRCKLDWNASVCISQTVSYWVTQRVVMRILSFWNKHQNINHFFSKVLACVFSSTECVNKTSMLVNESEHMQPIITDCGLHCSLFTVMYMAL